MHPSDLLDHLLTERDLSAAEFARMIGVGRSNVSDVLAGRADLSLTEWGNWLGALGMRLTYGLEPGGSGYYVGPDGIWPRLTKRLARGRQGTPTRTKGELLDLLEHAGVTTPEAWRTLLPLHLAPVLDSGWLHGQAGQSTEALAAQVRALREGQA